MLIQALPSGPNYPTENYQRLVVAALYAAQHRVTITTPYFVPDEAVLQALQTAVLRGVVVEVILPRRSDHWLVCAATRAYYEDLFRVGVRLYLYEKGILHAKTISIDDKIALIGSSNFDIRSFALNFEINLVCYGPDVTERLRAQQLIYRADSRRLSRRQWRQRSKLRLFGQRVARLLSPLL
jgi:cardiolipin synthase